MDLAYVTETFPPEINGVALTVERTVRHLREQGHTVQLVRPRQRGEAACDTAEEWRTSGAPLPMYPELRFGWASVAAFVRRLQARRPQLVHVATQGPLGWAAVLAAHRLGIPATSDFRTNFHWYSRYYRLGWLEPVVCGYLRAFHRRTATTFVPTRAVAQQLRAQRFERLQVLGRGVDARHFAPAARDAALRASWFDAGSGGDASSARVMLYVGRLAAEKNVPLVFDAFEAARAVAPRTRLVVVGDGPLRAQLERRHPAARFVGVQRGAALAAHYASADVFLFPSLSETFGNVTLEALASGLGVVAFDAAAAAEHVQRDVSGLLAAPGDARTFVALACRAATLPEAGLQVLRDGARVQALRADWGALLRRFEAMLLERAAVAPAGATSDVVLA